MAAFLQVLFSASPSPFILIECPASQIRSRQFNDFPSNWSEAKEINFIVLRQPNPVEDLRITFTKVEVVCGNNQTFLELNGQASWSESSVSEGVTIEYYELRNLISNVLIRSVSYV